MRAQRIQVGKAALKYALEELLNLADNDPLVRALTPNFPTIEDVLAMDEDQLHDLEYEDEEGNLHSPHVSKLNLVRILVSFHHMKKEAGQTIYREDWTSVDPDEFDKWRQRDYQPIKLGNLSQPTPLPQDPNLNSPSASSRRTPADEFRRTLKRDQSLFPKLTDWKQWDNYNRKLLSQARTQGVEKVLDGSYKPRTQEEKELFEEQQKFMFAVFESTLQTDIGKKAVRDNFDKSDAQAIYQTIKKHAEQSTSAELNAFQLLSYLTTARLGDGHWKGGCQGFVVNFADRARQFNDLSDDKDKLSDGML